jgi:aminopeptidase
MRRAVALLANREVRVTTPAGTDIRFQLGDRPFNQQDGDASRSRVGKARMRIDRHLELPAGILRVAPVEESVQGELVFPSIDLAPAGRAAGVRLTFAKGRIENATAREGQAVLDAYFKAAPALRQFREFCIGFNPKLSMRQGGDVVPYYGYGDAVVRLSFGDNEELAGQARGGVVRWNFFVDATVRVAGVAEPLVVNGRLNPKVLD